MDVLATAALLLTLVVPPAGAQVNAGLQKAEPSLPFTIAKVATFNLPWRIAFLPDGRMLITEKPGHVADSHPAGGEDTRRERAARLAQGTGRHARHLPFAALRDRWVRLSHVCEGSGAMAIESGARACTTRNWGEDSKSRGTRGLCGGRCPRVTAVSSALNRLLPRRPVSVPHGRRAPAHDTGTGSRTRRSARRSCA